MNHQPSQRHAQRAREELYASNHSNPKRYSTIRSATTQGPCICNRSIRLCSRTFYSRRSGVNTCSTTGSGRSDPLCRISSSCLLIPRSRVVKVFDCPPSFVLAVSASCRKGRLTVTTQRVVAVVETEEVLTPGFSWLFYISRCRHIHHHPWSKQRLQPRCVLPQQR